MKKGDLLYCKKSPHHENQSVFIIGKSYEIKNIDNNEIRIYCEEFTFYDEREVQLKTNSVNIKQMNIDSFFYTNTEVRKLKLKKIYQNA